MGHQSDLATEGLRAYAGDLQTPVGGQTVLLGGIGTVDAFGLTSNGVSAEEAVAAENHGDAILALVRRERVSLAQAARVFSDLGMERSTQALMAARDADMEDNAGVLDAIERLAAVAAKKYAAHGVVSELDFDIVVEVIALEQAVHRPPGLDSGRLLPGEGGLPPGQDLEFTPPGLDRDVAPPGQDQDRPRGTEGRP